ncbi:CAP domain-containing protein [Pseudonocardia sp. CA-107938]|uniref:CAP domain-containing protein n=1 Tax=Pseudonocardia sp. CA-107938 TaxID=3240021 RepID=UPI003D8DF14C
MRKLPAPRLLATAALTAALVVGGALMPATALAAAPAAVVTEGDCPGPKYPDGSCVPLFGPQPAPPPAPSPKPIKRLGRAPDPLLVAVNDARLHPEKYPPHGDTSGATMAACPAPFARSSALGRVALEHTKYLAGQPIDVVNTFPNMHKDPNGSLAWEDGGHIAAAGYNAGRGEIVATGFPTAEAAVRFWMQDDAPFNWGHRNLILNCSLAEAGAGHVAGGSGGHYWTVDMGTR